MIDLIDDAINMAITLGNVFNTIVLDARSYEQLHDELGQGGARLTGYKGYKIEVSYENAFSSSCFKIQMR